MNQEVIDNFIKVFEDYILEVLQDGMTGKYYLVVYTKEKETFRVFKLKEVLQKNNN